MISQLTSEQKENAKKVLKKALALIRKGWTKGALAIDKDKIPLLPELAVKREGCKFCSVGAIEGAAELTCLLDSEEFYAKAALREQLPKRLDGLPYRITSWNDHEDRRKPEVVAAFQAAIKSLE